MTIIRSSFPRKTDWVDAGGDVLVGLGQRVLATNNDDYPLLEVRSIVFDNEVESDETVELQDQHVATGQEGTADG